MAVNPLELRNLILQKLHAAGFDTSAITQDYWYAIAKALCLKFGEGGGGTDDHLVKANIVDAVPGALDTKTKGINGITLSVIEEGGVKKLQISGPTLPAPDDHLVKASDSDATAPGSLYAKTKGTNGITLSVITEGGVQKLQITGPTIPAGVTLSTAIPEPDGVGSAGNTTSGRAAAEGHVHPSTTKSTLFTGYVQSLNRGILHCCYTGYHTCTPYLFSGWTYNALTATWTKDVAGPLTAEWFDGVDPEPYSHVSPLVGKTVMAYVAGLTDDLPYTGPYIVENIGCEWNLVEGEWVQTDTHAQLRRDPDFLVAADFVKGMAFEIFNGTVYGGKTVKLDTDQPITLGTTPLSWVVVDSAPPRSTKGLYTLEQLPSVSQETVSLSASITDASGNANLYNDVFDSLDFVTLTGTPCLLTIPAGILEGQVTANIDTAGDGETVLTLKLSKKTPGGLQTQLYSFDTAPLTPGPYVLTTISESIPAKTITPEDSLVLDITARTTSTTAVRVTIIVSDADHSCRVSIPVTSASLTGDHRYLLNKNSRSAGVGQHEDIAIDLSDNELFTGLLAGKTTLDAAMDVLDGLVINPPDIIVLEDDWGAGGDGTFSLIPGFEFNVVAGRKYFLDVSLFALLGAEGWSVYVGGTAVGGCTLTHDEQDVVSLAMGRGIPNHRHKTVLVTDLTSASALATAYTDSESGVVNRRISGVIRISVGGSGTISILANTSPINYHSTVVLADSWARLRQTA